MRNGGGQQSDAVDYATETAVGARAGNEDRAAAFDRLAVVSDGMGGHAGGDRAAELTVEAVVSTLAGAVGRAADGGVPIAGQPPTGTVDAALVQRAVAAANDAVRAGRRADPTVAEMGATLTLSVATSVTPGGSRWLVAGVGDSPAWLVTPSGASLLTIEHTVAAELMRAGAIMPEEAAHHPGRHMLMRSIGPEQRVEADIAEVALRPGDALVLASDGLTEVLGSVDVHRLTAARPGAAATARGLVAAALDRGATDNVTVAVVRHVAISPHGAA